MATRSNLRDGRKTVQRRNNWAVRFNASMRANVPRDVNERTLSTILVFAQMRFANFMRD